MRPSSRVAFAVSWAVFVVTVVLAWRKVLAVPNGAGDEAGLLVACICGAGGLLLLMVWLRITNAAVDAGPALARGI